MTDSFLVRRHRLDRTWKRVTRRTLLAGSPLRYFRVSDAGTRVLDGLEAGDARASNTLVDRLLDAGAIHPLSSASSPTTSGVGDASAGRTAGFTARDVTLVMPRYRSDDPVMEPVPPAPVDGTTATGPVAVSRWVVVDDASPTPIAGATVRLDENLGPGGARNVGRRHVDTELIAFVDDDVDLDPDGMHPTAATGWLEPLLGHFDDPLVGLVAPRVAGDPTSSLDLGDEPARIRSGSRVSYVPAAAVIVRAAAFDAVGGFDETLRYGEDVDLVWRLDEAGWRCRYEPAATVHHRPRSSLRGRLRQQIGYGSAAAPLSMRHPRSLAPWRGDVALAALGVTTALGAPRATALVVAAQFARLRRRLPDLPPRDAAELMLRADADAIAHLARAIRRVWWPLALAAALVSRRARRTLLTAFLAAPRDGLTDIAYGWGVWKGMRAKRTLRPIVPRIDSIGLGTD